MNYVLLTEKSQNVKYDVLRLKSEKKNQNRTNCPFLAYPSLRKFNGFFHFGEVILIKMLSWIFSFVDFKKKIVSFSELDGLE